VIYLYAITEPGAPVPEGRGLDDQPLEVIETGALAALVSRHEQSTVDPDPEALWGHDRVVERAMSNGPVLPARFASTFADAADLRDALERDQADLRRQLDGVRGCVELAIRLSLPAPEAPAPRDGREYLTARLLQRQEARSAVEQTLEPLAEHAVRYQRRAVGGDPSTLTASYLVKACEVDEFAARVRELAARHSEFSLSCTGPWPPYSFVGEEAE
jgi:hypothetical protein